MANVVRSENYSSIAKWLHWVIAAIIAAQIGGGIYMHELEASDLKVQLYTMHKSFGFIVLFLSLIRLGWRFINPPPVLPVHMKAWERFVSHLTHLIFYILMIGVPITGWIIVSAHPLAQSGPFDTTFFGLFEMPNLPVPLSESTAELFVEIHAALAIGTFFLLVLHIAAALKHQFINKDEVLPRMAAGGSVSERKVSLLGWGVVILVILILLSSVGVNVVG